MTCHRFTALLLLAGFLAAPLAARAAESYDNCDHFIDSLPATVSTGGTWCLRHDLSTAISSGYAIDITTDDATIDCNDFKIGGLAAGDASDAYGIAAIPQQFVKRRNIAIRHCNIRGFSIGISLQSGIGHLVEDNRLDNNLTEGIEMIGCYHCRVRRNAVFDTGGHTSPTANGLDTYGIIGSADMVDNIVDGVLASGDYGDAYGISASGSGIQVGGNRIGGLASPGAYGKTYGINATFAPNASIAGNRILAATVVGAANGAGIAGGNAGSSFCTGNTIANFAIAMNNCADDGGNASY